MNPSYIYSKEIVHQTNSQTAIICVHDISSSPEEFMDLSENVKTKSSVSVYVPRLLGHGTHSGELLSFAYQDYEFQLLTFLKLIAKRHSNILLVGSGLGANLVIDLSFQKNVSQIVLIQPILYGSVYRKLCSYLSFSILVPIKIFREIHKKRTFGYSCVPLTTFSVLHQAYKSVLHQTMDKPTHIFVSSKKISKKYSQQKKVTIYDLPKFQTVFESILEKKNL